jgi:hypothetical protein
MKSACGETVEDARRSQFGVITGSSKACNMASGIDRRAST